MTHKKLYPDDQGHLLAAMIIKDDQIVIHFGKPVSWLSLGRAEAEAMVKALQEKIAQL
jgi:hypothetical protein